jgi:hypothetical protein
VGHDGGLQIAFGEVILGWYLAIVGPAGSSARSFADIAHPVNGEGKIINRVDS